MISIEFNTKIEGINILEKYFKKFNSCELSYYLEKSPKMSMNNFMNSNVYEPEDIELKNLFLSHLFIILKKIFNMTSKLNNINKPIKISFISNSIYWNNLFVISNTIFVKYQYLIEIFECIEYNEYKSMDDVYIEEDKIFDMSLLKNICNSIYSILQNLNPNIWNEYISINYGCVMVSIEDIKFSSNYKIIQESNLDLSYGKIPVYWLGDDNIYASFNSISSKYNTFCPYWEQQIIKLDYVDGVYIETKQIDNNNNSFVNKLIPTPFENKSIQLTNTIMYNLKN